MSTAARLPLPGLSRGRFSCSVDDAGAQRDARLAGCSFNALTDERLFSQVGVRIAFTERQLQEYSTPDDGSLISSGSTQDNPANALKRELDVKSDEGARIVAEAFGVPRQALISPRQVHGTEVVCPSAPGAQAFQAACAQAQEGADAIVMPHAGYGVLLFMADCLPLIIVAPSGAFAVVHCGWRGTIAGIAGKALGQLVERTGEDPADFNAYIGAYIHAECFEVSEDIAQQFAETYGSACTPDARHVDLARAVAEDLTRCGMVPERIDDAGICTVCATDRFFSYRAEDGACGRHGAFAFRPDGPDGPDGL